MTTATPEKQHHIDPVFKQILEDKLPLFKAGVKTQVEVNRLPLTIDAIVTVDTEEARQHLENETPFFYFLPCNQVEFKGVEDPLTIGEYHRIFGRTNFYLSEHDVEPDGMTVTIVCANKPKNVLEYKQIRDRFRRIQPGYYRSANRPNLYLIVIRELPLIPQNYLLLLFTGDAEQFRSYLEQMVTEGNVTYIRYAWRTHPQITQEVLTMKRRNGEITYEESLLLFAESFGDDLLEAIPVEKRLKGLDPAQRLEGLTSDQILTALSQNLSVEERKVVIEKLLQSLMAAIPVQKTQQATPA